MWSLEEEADWHDLEHLEHESVAGVDGLLSSIEWSYQPMDAKIPQPTVIWLKMSYRKERRASTIFKDFSKDQKVLGP
jgi:hypothetical protein